MAEGDVSYFRYVRHGGVEQEVGPSDATLPRHHGHYSYLKEIEKPMQSVDDLLEERHKTHGDFSDNARFSQAFKEMCRSSPAWAQMPEFMREALDAKALKMSRILSGNFMEPDHWKDDAGYDWLVIREL